MIFLTSLFLWLEITVFQIWTALTFVLFLLVTLIQIFRRKIILTEREVQIKNVLSLNNKKIFRSEIKKVEKTRMQLKITDKYRTYSLLMLPKSKNKCFELLESSDLN